MNKAPGIFASLKNITKKLAGKEHAAPPRCDAGNGLPDEPIRIIVESLPRSGSSLFTYSIAKCANLGLATVFQEETRNFKGTPVAKNGVFFDVVEKNRQYIVKSHFFHVVRYTDYQKQAATIRLTCFPFDAYYSWGRMLCRDDAASKKESYKLKADSPEWNELKNYIYLNKIWFDAVPGGFFLRYEDLALDFDHTMNVLCDFVNVDFRSKFPEFRPPVYRSYFTEDYLRIMDASVFTYLCDEFLPGISRLYPEKVPSLERTLATIDPSTPATENA